MRVKRQGLRSRRGATLVLVAVSITALAAMGAVAIDLGMLFKSRSDAQKAAEAAALAGASAFIDYTVDDPQAVDTADARARRYAESNSILNDVVAPAEVQSVEIIPDSQKVRVVVGRAGIGTWFARLIGVSSVPIAAKAAAIATNAGNSGCVKPWAVPDMWQEATQDVNPANQLNDNGEEWTYTPGEDTYEPSNPDAPAPTQTGYGSGLRNSNADYTDDLGRLVVLKYQTPGDNDFGPGHFHPFSARGSNSGSAYRDDIENCSPDPVVLGQSYQLINGNMVGPTRQGVNELISRDPNAHWDDQDKAIEGSQFPDWHNSPRVIKIALFDPGQLANIGPGQSSVDFNNIALLFLEGFNQGENNLYGRFLYFATGSGEPGPGAGSLVKRLRLVE
jgi:putative Flp pilus-assembly TadE/G-like protein